MDTALKTRNSRWDRNPRPNCNGKPAVAHIVERDLELFKLLARYRFLAADYIHAFSGGEYRSLTRRLDLLSRRPNYFLNRPIQQRETADANYRNLIYELDDKGAQFLRDRRIAVPRKRSHRNFAHELMVCQIAASIELGTHMNTTIEIIPWSVIMASDRFPEATRKLSNPTSIPFGDEFVTPDWEPFVIALDSGDGPKVFLPGFEADCGTEPIDAGDPERSSIRAKFRAYLTVLGRGIHRKHFGVNTCMVAFITTSEARMHSMKALLERMEVGQLAKHFIFKHMPAFASYEQSAPATGHMLTEPWQRVGGLPDFLLNQA